MADGIDILMGFLMLAMLLLIVGAIAGVLGLDSMRAPSEYTGQVIDVEHNKGIVFRTTQLRMKTHVRSSEIETFCIHERNMPGQLEDARQALATGERIRVEYERPLFVWVGECKPGTSIVTNIEFVGNETNG